ncbi:double-strand break repair protein AddB [Sulfitobacter albidus]|uniref:Double-strand break repair protein AddB n=1 Tax=Sulfitobacter albidus TaxID=2829501 RepID=A0A975JDC0_9RHOB|nr:double-strand break repair protein AddB [Sulfitobacter albidus]QUJ76166.1 double-strand break repair protein AddB [Sulfitobacter albidus]
MTLFEAADAPRVFGVAPGVDFPAALISGLEARSLGQPPEALARVDLIVNTERMARRLRQLFEDGPPRLLPRIRTITDLGTLLPQVVVPPGTSALRRRLELIRLITGLMAQSETITPSTSLYDLADSLAGLIDEMQGEGVTPEDIAALDVSDQSGHWERAKQFLGIVQTYLQETEAAPDTEARQRLRVAGIAAAWEAIPPAHPVIIAGSTGSRGTTMMLMQAVARLPQGALVLPGFDSDMPADVWAALDDPMMSEDHPQYRYHKLMRDLGASANAVRNWHDVTPPAPARNRLVSLSLRPAPVTDAWRIEGPGLGDLTAAVTDMTMVLADTPRAEALAIALRLRRAAQDGQTAALITPDRMLSRRVTAALDRWGVLPDDSAGTPLHLSPPGRFLRHIAGLFAKRMDAEMLLTLLKHPLTHSTATRNLHVLHTQRLEQAIRHRGLPYPTGDTLRMLVDTEMADTGFAAWITWICESLLDKWQTGEAALTHWTAEHLRLAEAVAAGVGGDTAHGLWQQRAGVEAQRVMAELLAEAPYGADLDATDYADLAGALIAAGEVRDRDAPHPGIMIWGTLEARVQGAELVILGGLNDGTWPEAPPPDPWLNRKMRHDAGLLLPERRVGLAAHDYQQSVCAPQVWITRAIRSEDAETVPSRWINRLENLMKGLHGQGGADAWSAMAARGQIWLDQARALEAAAPLPPARRPSPRPPVAVRPRKLSVTEIKTLIRDPYAIYAKHTLGLRAQRPLVQSPDALLRGVTLHTILERFVKSVVSDPTQLSRDAFLDTAGAVLAEDVPWPTARALWHARIARVADWFLEREAARLANARPIAFERDAMGTLEIPEIGFSLHGVADRMDQSADGAVQLYDYKTGKPPTSPQQKLFDKQLLIEAAMVEQGAFPAVGVAPVSRAAFIGMGRNPHEVDAPLDEEPTADVLADLRALLTRYLDPAQGFTARRMMEMESFAGEFDQLARFGEWDATDTSNPEDLT